MRHCCVVNCKNNAKNNKNVKFYKFPRAWFKAEQKRLWIKAVNRKNSDGSPWSPKESDEICSAHFIGNEKSECQISPNYVPTIFPSEVYKNRKINGNSLKRHERFMKRRNQNKILTPKISSPCITQIDVKLYQDGHNIGSEGTNTLKNIIYIKEEYSDDIDQKDTVSIGCQVKFFSSTLELNRTFICNRYVINNLCDAEIQTEISDL